MDEDVFDDDDDDLHAGAIISSDLDKIFEIATNHVQILESPVHRDSLLYLYARFKQVRVGPCNIPKPGFLDIAGRKKWDAWMCMKDMSTHDAMNEYINKVKLLDPEWEPQVDSVKPMKKVFGPVQSRPSRPPDLDELCDDSSKSVFDWCKEGRLDKVQDLISVDKRLIDAQGEEGMALLHWATDRGNTDMVKYLIEIGCDLNITDSEGQSALHYACTCEYPDIVKLLIENGIKTNITDSDETLAENLTNNTEILQIFTPTSNPPP